MTEQKNDSRKIMEIVVTEEEASIQTETETFLDAVKIIKALNDTVQGLSKGNKIYAIGVLTCLINECGITKDDFDQVQKNTNTAASILKIIKNFIDENGENDENND